MLQKYLTPFVILLVAWPTLTFGAMSSSQYYIYSDSIGVDGGSFSSSTSYSITDTIGESPVGLISSATYELRGGFQNMERGTVSISVGSPALDLGTLSIISVASASTTVVVTSEALTGYTLSISNVNGTGIAAVVDGVVTAGNDEYGVAVAGDHKSFSDDRGVSVGRVLASVSAPVYSATSTLTFKASYSPGFPARSFNQTLTLLVTAN